MALPKVTINVLNSQLGRITPIDDGVAGLIASSAVAPASLAFGTSALVTSVAEAETLGITAAWQTTNNSLAHTHVSEFFAAAGTGAKLWVMIVVDTLSMQNITDKAHAQAYATKLLNDAGGKIRLLGITRKPDGSYTPLKTKGMDDDAYEAMVKLNVQAVDFAAAFKPFVGLIDGRDYQGNVSNLYDARGGTSNNVAICLANAGTTGKSAGIGLLLGSLAKLPVQRSIARVKNGELPISEAKLTNEVAIEASNVEAIHDKGYIVIRTFAGRSGYYFSDDPTATIASDDYSSIARRRVINKVLQIAYDVYVNEIAEEIEIDPDGKMNPAVIKSLQGAIENAIDLQMTANAEISSCRAVIDPNQNVLSTDKVVVALYVVPVGYSKTIEVNIGFENPSIS